MKTYTPCTFPIPALNGLGIWLIETALTDRNWPLVFQIPGGSITIGLAGVNTVLITIILLSAVWNYIKSKQGGWRCSCGVVFNDPDAAIHHASVAHHTDE